MIDKRVGIIGGSGVDFSKDIKEAQWVNLDCVYGKPSDLLLYGLLNDVPIAFLPRHARGHIIPTLLSINLSQTLIYYLIL